jgi:uncharacterized membrane-anchored protein
MRMSNNNTNAVVAIGVLAFVGWAAFWIALIYVVAHFIAKFW